jgi:HK97 family phage portal protein
MSFIDTILGRLGYSKAKGSESDLLDTMIANYQLSFGVEKPVDIESYGKAYSADEWVYSCVRTIAEASNDVGLRLYRDKVGKDGKVDKEEITDHPAIDLFHKVNNHTTADEFKEATLTSLELQGNSYWYIVRDSLNIPREMYYMRPDWTKIVPDKENFIKGYIYDSGHDKQSFEPEEVLHFKYFDPRSFYYGLSPLTAARVTVESNIYSNRYSRSFFKNSARPDGFLTTEKNLSDATVKRLITQWEKSHKGYDNASRTAILEGGMEYKLIGINQKDADFIAQQKNYREKILAIFRVPPVMVNIYEYANYANSEQQRKIFWADVESKKLNKISSYINEFLIKPIWGDEIYVEFDYSGVEALNEEENSKVDRIIKLVNAGLKTPNEARQLLGDDTFTDRAADMLYMPMNMIPIGATPEKPADKSSELAGIELKKKHLYQQDAT